MVFIVAISPQTILFEVSWMARYSLVGMDLFDMSRDVLVDDGGWNSVAGTILVAVHGGHLGEVKPGDVLLGGVGMGIRVLDGLRGC